MDAFERWKNSSWKEQVSSKQPVICLGCLNQNRDWTGKPRCSNLDTLLDMMRHAQAKIKCPYKVTH